MAEETLFHPYKIIHQSSSNLQLQAGSNVKLIRRLLIGIPLLLLGVAVVLSLTQKEPVILYAMGGTALLELLIFSFIKIPADLRMDRIGFTLKTVSVQRTVETDYLWTDVDHIRQRITRAKNSTTLVCEAILTSGKKVQFLNFPNYLAKKQKAADMRTVFSEISNKAVVEK
jgi:hypothetical protein